MTRKKKHRNSEIEQVIVYMKQLVVVFFFSGDRTAGDVYDGSIQAHMDRLYRKKFNTQKLASATVWYPLMYSL